MRTDKRAADRIAERKRLGEYDPNSRMAQKARNDLYYGGYRNDGK